MCRKCGGIQDIPCFTSIQEEPIESAFIFSNVMHGVAGQIFDERDGQSWRCSCVVVGTKPRNGKQLIAAFVEFCDLSTFVVADVLLYIFVVSVQGKKLQD